MTSTRPVIRGLLGFFAGLAVYVWATGGDLSVLTIAAFTVAYLLIWFGIQWAQRAGERSGDGDG
jgi:uncharacterized membrane protein